MNKPNNVYFNHTLNEYNRKYRNYRYVLLKYTTKQVEDFDRHYSTYNYNNKTYSLGDNYLLKDRKWWFIEGTYYEIPRAPRWAWFRNLNIAYQIGISVLGIGAVTSATIFPILSNTLWKEKIEDIKYEEIMIEYNEDYGCHTKTISLIKDINYKIICTLDNQYSEVINGESFFTIMDSSGKEKTNDIMDLISVSYNSNKFSSVGLATTKEKFSELRNYINIHPYNYILANYTDEDVDYNNVFIGKNSFDSINNKLEICFKAKQSISEYTFMFGFPL